MPQDHIKYDTKDEVRWLFDSETRTFAMLNLPFFFENAPDNVKHDLIEWIRVRAEDSTAEMPESVIQYRDDPKTKQLRARIKRGYATLEDFA